MEGETGFWRDISSAKESCLGPILAAWSPEFVICWHHKPGGKPLKLFESLSPLQGYLSMHLSIHSINHTFNKHLLRMYDVSIACYVLWHALGMQLSKKQSSLLRNFCFGRGVGEDTSSYRGIVRTVGGVPRNHLWRGAVGAKGQDS